jgi:hypothetical protein
MPSRRSIPASIARLYPGTRLAVTELNYGGENHISGAIAIADVLGIFADRNVYMANHWGPIDRFVSAGYRLYRNVDGRGESYGSKALPSSTGDNERSAIHASLDSLGRLHLITINRGFNDTIEAMVTLPEGMLYRPGKIYRLTGESETITGESDHGLVAGGVFRCLLPPLSIAHVILEPDAELAVREDGGLKESLKIHPTPATSEVVLGYTLRQSGKVHLSLVDPLGRRIHEIFDDRRCEGLHTMTIPLDGLAPGLYFWRMSTEAGVQVARMVVR